MSSFHANAMAALACTAVGGAVGDARMKDKKRDLCDMFFFCCSQARSDVRPKGACACEQAAVPCLLPIRDQPLAATSSQCPLSSTYHRQRIYPPPDDDEQAMATIDHAYSGYQHPFLAHLVAILSIYELGPLSLSAPIPKYDGPSDWQTDSILRSLAAMARRLYTAEEAYSEIRAQTSCGPDNKKKRRSIGDSPRSVSSGSSTSGSILADFTTVASSSVGPSSASPFFTSSSSEESLSNYHDVGNALPKDDVPFISQQQHDIDMDDESHPDSYDRNTDAASTTATLTRASTREPRTPSPMTISLQGVSNPLDRSRVYSDRPVPPQAPSSAPPSSIDSSLHHHHHHHHQHNLHHQHHITCSSCGASFSYTCLPAPSTTTVPAAPIVPPPGSAGHVASKVAAAFSSTDPPPLSSPLVVPPGPLAAAAFESGMSAMEELRLLKAQVQDVARVCNAVARGDLSQKITVPVQGVVMVQLKEVINAMVSFPSRSHLSSAFIHLDHVSHRSLHPDGRWINWVSLQRKSPAFLKRSERKGKFLFPCQTFWICVVDDRFFSSLGDYSLTTLPVRSTSVTENSAVRLSY